MTNSEILERRANHGVRKTPEIVRKGTGAVGDGSHTGRFGAGAGADTGINGMTGRAPGGAGLQYQGHHRHDGPVLRGSIFVRVQEMGRPEGRQSQRWCEET